MNNFTFTNRIESINEVSDRTYFAMVSQFELSDFQIFLIDWIKKEYGNEIVKDMYFIIYNGEYPGNYYHFYWDFIDKKTSVATYLLLKHGTEHINNNLYECSGTFLANWKSRRPAANAN